MAVLTPDLFFNLAQDALDCICVALELESECGCPCRQIITVGPPVADECCNGGQLAVYMERVFVHGNFPAQESGPIFCSSPLAGDFVIQLLRCAPTVKDDGSAPTPAELIEASRLLYQDLYIAIRGLICCLAAAKRARKFVIRDSRLITPLGGCHGFEVRFSVELHDPAPV